MNQPKIFNSTGEKLNMNIIFSFTCKENGKNYVMIFLKKIVDMLILIFLKL